jgi:SAM-dependent methyltransferase
MDAKSHWSAVYRTKPPAEVSWHQPRATLSLGWITTHLPDREAPVIDVGGGASTLVDGLFAAGYRDVTVLDVADAALALAARRLGRSAEAVRWLEADVLTAELARESVALWHDRAVFHFLTQEEDRRRYSRQVRRSLRPGGLLLIATFASDGPTRCSGLDVVRYDADALQAEFGSGFERVAGAREVHRTPAGGEQAFVYLLLRYEPVPDARPAPVASAVPRSADPS